MPTPGLTWRRSILASVALHLAAAVALVAVRPATQPATHHEPLTLTPIYLLPSNHATPPAEVAIPLETPAPTLIDHARAAPLPPTAVDTPTVEPPQNIVVNLGSEHGSPTPTKSFIQSTDTGEHLAKPFEADQPQLDRAKTPLSTPAGDEGNQGRGEQRAVPPSPPTPAEQHTAPEPRLEPASPQPKPMPSTPPGETQPPEKNAQPEQTPVPPRSTSSPNTAAPTNPTPARTEQSESAATGTPGPRTPPTQGGADRDSDATSVRQGLVYRNGRVDAGEGLDIRTVRPEFALTTRALRSPSPPVLDIRFGRDGRVKDVFVLKSSGYPDEVDGPVVSAAYNWRATGKALAQLTHPASTVSLRITIVLN